MGPAAALMFPPMVTLPPMENARTASSLLRIMTKSVMSAPIWRPQPTPPVAIQDGADHDPSGRRAMTRPEPALPEKTKPALITEKTARPAKMVMRPHCTRARDGRQQKAWHRNAHLLLAEVQLWGWHLVLILGARDPLEDDVAWYVESSVIWMM